MDTPTDRSVLIRLAMTLPVGSAERRVLLARVKYKTPEAAEAAFKKYQDKLRTKKTDLTPKDFYDPEGGAEAKDPYDPYTRKGPQEEKKEKAETKQDKGKKKHTERQKEQKSKFEDQEPKTWGGSRRENRKRLKEMRGHVSAGREKASKEMADMTPAQLRKKVHSIIRSKSEYTRKMFGGDTRRLDPDKPGDLDKALKLLQRPMGASGLESRLNQQYGEYEYKKNKGYKDELTELAYAHALLSKYKKQKGDKGEKAKRTTKVNETAKKHGVGADDVESLRGLAKGWKKKLSDKAVAKLEDKVWAKYMENRTYDMDPKEYKKWGDIFYGLDGGPTKAQQLAKQKREFLKNADPEMKKRMKDMSPADFAEMLAAIMDEEDVDGGKQAATVSDRSVLIRLASSLPVGSDDRRTILAGLHKTAADPPPIMATVDVGDIFYSSWGYDQTNVDFYEVTGKTKTMVVLRMVEKKIVGNPDGPSVKVVPAKPIKYDTDRSRSGPFKKKVKEYRGEAYVSLSSYASAYAWNGKPQSQTGGLYGH